jgi:hypothetical protein
MLQATKYTTNTEANSNKLTEPKSEHAHSCKKTFTQHLNTVSTPHGGHRLPSGNTQHHGDAHWRGGTAPRILHMSSRRVWVVSVTALGKGLTEH